MTLDASWAQQRSNKAKRVQIAALLRASPPFSVHPLGTLSATPKSSTTRRGTSGGIFCTMHEYSTKYRDISRNFESLSTANTLPTESRTFRKYLTKLLDYSHLSLPRSRVVHPNGPNSGNIIGGIPVSSWAYFAGGTFVSVLSSPLLCS